MYLATLVCPISMPSLSSSPWIRGAPQSGLARLMSRIKWRISNGTVGRPLRDLDFQRQYALNPARCHRSRVSGLTIVSDAGTLGNNRHKPTKINRSVLLKAGLFGQVRRRTLICWRSIRFSASSATLDRNRPTSAHQINLQKARIGQQHRPIRAHSPAGRGFRQGQGVNYFGATVVDGTPSEKLLITALLPNEAIVPPLAMANPAILRAIVELLSQTVAAEPSALTPAPPLETEAVRSMKIEATEAAPAGVLAAMPTVLL